MTDEPYASRGLSVSQLEAILVRLARAVQGDVIAVAFAGRGGVFWHAGAIRLVGPIGAEFERAVAGVLDGTDLASGIDVRDALLSMGGARLVVDRVGVWH